MDATLVSVWRKACLCSRFGARRLKVFAAQRWKRRRTGPLCSCESDFLYQQPPMLGICKKQMQTDPIFSCFAASSSNSNTPGRHCQKNARKNFFWNVQTHDLDYMYLQMCLLNALKANSKGIDVQSRQSLPRLTSQKGIGGVTPKQLYLFLNA